MNYLSRTYHKSRKQVFLAMFFVAIIAVFSLYSVSGVGAESLEELQKDISQKKEEIKKLEEEAVKYRQEIAAKQSMGKTLKTELDRITSEIKRVRADIAVTEKKVQKTQLEIRGLYIEIGEKESSIATFKTGLGALIQAFAEKGEESLIELIMKHDTLSDFFQQIDFLGRAQERIKHSLSALRILREDLLAKKVNAEEKKEELENLSVSLKDKKGIQEGIQKNKAEILTSTKNEEKKYQALLRDREKQRQSLENEITQIEERIRVTIDPLTLPSKRHGILGPPLPEIALVPCREQGAGEKNCVTQFFGRTDFANAGGYNGNGHNGADFRAETGTPTLAAEDGVVESVDDTDVGCRGASYGKWILIRHSNNLSTLYGHLSAISVSAGQNVKRGDRIGYSGKTGYATGPHLHFTVFVSKAVEVKTIISKVCGRAMVLPVAGSDPISGVEGYLNPMDYL